MIIKNPKKVDEKYEFQADLSLAISKLPILKDSNVIIHYPSSGNQKTSIEIRADLDNKEIERLIKEFSIKLPWWARIALKSGLSSKKILEVIGESMASVIEMVIGALSEEDTVIVKVILR